MSSTAQADTRRWPLVITAVSRALMAAVMVRLVFVAHSWWMSLAGGAIAVFFLTGFVSAVHEVWRTSRPQRA
jgi:hypothetical protein